MALSDIDITDWSTTAASNPPSDATQIGRNLADQFRNLKSVARQQSLEKQWQRTGLIGFGANNPLVSGVASISIFGDVAATFGGRRKVRLRPSDGTASFVFCGVRSALYDGSTSTNVELAVLSGSFTDDVEYTIDVGTEDPDAPSLPLYTESGTGTVVNTDTNTTVTFAHSQPDTEYFLKATVISTTSSEVNATIVATVVKNAGNAVIGLHTAPGANTNTVFGWTLLRETS